MIIYNPQNIVWLRQNGDRYENDVLVDSNGRLYVEMGDGKGGLTSVRLPYKEIPPPVDETVDNSLTTNIEKDLVRDLSTTKAGLSTPPVDNGKDRNGFAKPLK